VGLADEVGWTGREPLVLAPRDPGLEGDVTAPDEEEPFAGSGMKERAALGHGQIEVPPDRLDALGRLAEEHPQVALFDDRLAIVRAQELGDVLGRELEPGVVVAGRSGELLDELGAGALAHDLPGLIDDDELWRQVGPHRVPEDAERRELGDVTDLGSPIADRPMTRKLASSGKPPSAPKIGASEPVAQRSSRWASACPPRTSPR